MSDKTYNGWSNYATWRINLEIFDDFPVGDLDGTDDAEVDIYSISKQLQEYAEDCIFSGHDSNSPQYCNLIEDYARAFLSDVNWYEIAKHLVNDYIAENQDETN
jgi:hypothetical protein